MMGQIRKQILTIVLLAAFAALAPAAQAASVVTTIVTNPLTGIALDGYDPISYFTEVEPLEGTSSFSYDWGGVTWYFANVANRDVFKASPEIYAPQFGGHCTMSLSRGFLSDGNPRVYLVLGQQLFLFYSAANREAFLLSPAKALTDAIAQWPNLAATLSTQ